MRQLIVRVAAIVVIGVFASLPTLARVHDHLSTHDDVASFRLSKNLERPHEKIGAATVVDSAVALDVRDPARDGDVAEAPTPAFSAPAAAPLVPRAPPVH